MSPSMSSMVQKLVIPEESDMTPQDKSKPLEIKKQQVNFMIKTKTQNKSQMSYIKSFASNYKTTNKINQVRLSENQTRLTHDLSEGSNFRTVVKKLNSDDL
jgi:hypothetical protein